MRGFSGVIPIVQTPFDEDDRLDAVSLRALARYARDLGVGGLAFPGFASEWWRLSDAECLQAAETIVEASEGAVEVILNVTAQSTVVAVDRARRYEDMGASGLMCLEPFVLGVPPRERLAHLEAVMDATALPHVLQLSPALTGVALDVEGVAALCERHENLRSIKVDFVPPGPVISKVQEAVRGKEVTFLIGYSGLQLPDAIRRGASGLMSGCGHIEADMVVFQSLIRSRGRVTCQFRQILPLLNLEMQTMEVSIAAHKTLLARKGIIASSRARQPSVGLDAFQEEELVELWRAVQGLEAEGRSEQEGEALGVGEEQLTER